MWIIILVVVLLVAGGAYYFLTQDNGTNTNNTNNANVVVNTSVEANSNSSSNANIDTTDWLTYRNPEFGYSFKYPKTLQVTEHESPTLFGSAVLQKAMVPGIEGDPFITVYVSNDTTDDTTAAIEQNEFATTDKNATWNSFQVDGTDAQFTQLPFNISGTFFKNFYVLEHLGKTILISTYVSDGQQDVAIDNFSLL